MKILEKVRNLFKFREKEPKIWHKRPKTHSLMPKHILKQALRWMKFRDSMGNLVVKEETNIDEVISFWTKGILTWLINIVVSGSLIQIAILPFYNPGLKLAPFTIFSFGLASYIIAQTWKSITNGLRSVASAIPKR